MPKGIGYLDPAMFELNALQAGASNPRSQQVLMDIGKSQASKGIGGAVGSSGVGDMQNKLAIIQAMGTAAQSGSGLGSSLGGAAGAGIGGTLGGAAGAGAGGSIGGTIGSVVDYMMEKETAEKAEQKRIDALRKEKINLAHRNSSNAWLDSLASRRGIALSEFQEKMDRYQLARQMRNKFISDIFSRIAATQARKQAVNQQFIQSRRVL